MRPHVMLLKQTRNEERCDEQADRAAPPRGQLVVSHPYAGAPVVAIVGTLVLLTNVYVALIALMVLTRQER